MNFSVLLARQADACKFQTTLLESFRKQSNLREHIFSLFQATDLLYLPQR